MASLNIDNPGTPWGTPLAQFLTFDYAVTIVVAITCSFLIIYQMYILISKSIPQKLHFISTILGLLILA